jgi:hypothetical protein
MSHLRRALRAVTWAATAGAGLLTIHTAVNARLLRTPPSEPPVPSEPVSVLLPLRDEAHRLEPCLTALRTALDACGGRAELVVLDDESSDGTAQLVRELVGDDARVRVVTGTSRPPGWLGKPWACAQLAELADQASTVLLFVDADVVLAPHAVTATVAQLRQTGLDLVSPYPRQLTVTPAERLVQPLLQWSWLTTLPLRLAERSQRSSTAAANGQLLAIDRAAYRRAGGHGAVRGEVLDDLALLRAVKATGGRGGVTDGTHLAECRMYDGWPALRDGYTKSLWSALGSPAGAVTTVVGLCLLYVWPPVAATCGSRVGALGYAAGVAGRAVAARRTDGRVWPDAFAHPASVALLGWLTARSWSGRRRGTLHWKGRPIEARPPPA